MANKHAHSHRHVKQPKHGWVAQSPSVVPQNVQDALKAAMAIEQVPTTDYDDLLWIMAQESSGVVGARNPKSTARGLFQLLAAQADLNPHGEKSFGNAIEECQGGIHYIIGRYHSVKAARIFWEKHKWY